MPRRTNDFQRLVAEIHKHAGDAVITESAMLPDSVTGSSREVDIYATGQGSTSSEATSIECRDRRRPADVTWVDEMLGKHARLPTDRLVLASRSSFTREAARVADHYGVEHVDFKDVDAGSEERLFPDVSSLWGKTWKLIIDRVEITVETLKNGDFEWFKTVPDTQLFLSDGTPICSAQEIAMTQANFDGLHRQLGPAIGVEHKFAQFGWHALELNGMRLCVQCLDPLEFRPIRKFNIVAKCVVTVNEFPLAHGKYGDRRVAWGKGEMLGSEMMVVATRTGGGREVVSLTSTPAADAKKKAEERRKSKAKSKSARAKGKAGRATAAKAKRR